MDQLSLLCYMCADLDIGCVEVPKRGQSSGQTISATADP